MSLSSVLVSILADVPPESEDSVVDKVTGGNRWIVIVVVLAVAIAAAVLAWRRRRHKE